MSSVLDLIYKKAARYCHTIVLPEGCDTRVLRASVEIFEKYIARPILLGDKKQILKKSAELKLNIDGIEIIDNKDFLKFTRLYDLLKSIYQNKKKHITKKELLAQINNPLYFASLLVKSGYAQGCVAGVTYATADVLRSGFSILGTKTGIKTISGAFIMVMPDNSVFVFADCAVVINPSAEQLADIAISSADTMLKLLGLKPKIAMLSFSTHGSAKHEFSDKVITATNIIRTKSPELVVDGELQLDAAIVKEVAKIKTKNSVVDGEANVLVFPDLNASNIGYKLVQRLAGAKAIGPILQGIGTPMNDLSRGATVTEIVNTVAITVLQCG